MIKANPASTIAPLTRLAHATCVARFTSQVGAPVEKAYTRAGLPICCDDPNVLVPVHCTWEFFEQANRLVDPAVGWLAGISIGGQSLSSELAARIEHAPTLYLGMQSLVREACSESSELKLLIQHQRDSVRLSTEYRMKSWPGYDVDQAYQLAVMVNLIQHYIGWSWSPVKIGIEARRAPDQLRDLYPGARIFTDQPQGFIEVDCRILHQKCRVRPVCSDDVSSKNNLDFRAAVRSLIEAYLYDGPVNARKIAQLLGVSERTLFRRLRQQRSSFQTELDTARFDSAKSLIYQHDLSCRETAARIGISDAGNFSRMFRRIGGLSPSQYRMSLNA